MYDLILSSLPFRPPDKCYFVVRRGKVRWIKCGTLTGIVFARSRQQLLELKQWLLATTDSRIAECGSVQGETQKELVYDSVLHGATCFFMVEEIIGRKVTLSYVYFQEEQEEKQP